MATRIRSLFGSSGGALASDGCAPRERPRGVVRIATWNILHGGGPQRTPAQAIRIAELAPDVIVLTEFRAARSSQLLAPLADAGLCHVALAPGGERVNRVCVVARWALEVEAQATMPIVDIGGTRAALDARLLSTIVRTPGAPISLLAAHIPDEGSPSRRDACWAASVAWARRHAQARAIFAGDLNTSRPGLDSHRPNQTCTRRLGELETLGFRDAWRVARPGEHADSWVGPMGERHRIDAIWLSDGVVRGLQSACYDGLCADRTTSDHALCWVDVSLPG